MKWNSMNRTLCGERKQRPSNKRKFKLIETEEKNYDHYLDCTVRGNHNHIKTIHIIWCGWMPCSLYRLDSPVIIKRMEKTYFCCQICLVSGISVCLFGYQRADMPLNVRFIYYPHKFHIFACFVNHSFEIIIHFDEEKLFCFAVFFCAFIIIVVNLCV